MTTSTAQSAAAVVLACSHLDYLERLITELKAQTRPLDEIIVIYQGTSNAIACWLAEQKDLIVLKQDNRGSAGGFCTGLEESIRRGHDWTWIFDDDAIPQRNAFEELTSRPYFADPETVYIASRIVDRYGKTYMAPRPAHDGRWYATVLDDRCVRVVEACWPGLLVSSTAVKKYGLPISEFFFREEDLEFSDRLARKGKAYCAIGSVVVHYQEDRNWDPHRTDFGKFAYFVRNRIARAKLRPGPWPMKLLRSIRTAGYFLVLILKREAPVRSLPWIFYGLLLFWPRVRFPKNDG